MDWTSRGFFLAILLVATGSINTLFAKGTSKIVSSEDDEEDKPFRHPLLLTSFMFLGEALCFCVYQLKRSGEFLPKFNPLILSLPAFADLLATFMMYIGLSLTYASSFQMLRGSAIIFTAAFSILFLKKNISFKEWMGIVIVMCGLTIVAIADFLSEDILEIANSDSVLIGDVLIVLAQIVCAAQMIYEEKYVSELNIDPLEFVGWEGIFGFTMSVALQAKLYFIPYDFTDWIGDPVDGLRQIYNNNLLLTLCIGIVFSTAFFNFAGLSVAKEMSSITRMMLDSLRTVVIWIIALCFGWQQLDWIQVIGFLILIIGLFVFNIMGNKTRKEFDFFKDGLPIIEPISIYNILDKSVQSY